MRWRRGGRRGRDMSLNESAAQCLPPKIESEMEELEEEEEWGSCVEKEKRRKIIDGALHSSEKSNMTINFFAKIFWRPSLK